MKFLILLSVLVCSFQLQAQCNQGKSEVETLLNPYIFDNSTQTLIQHYDRGYSQSFTFGVYKSRPYKFAFQLVEGNQEDIHIVVSEFNKKTLEKTPVYDSKKDDGMLVEVLSSSKHYTVDVVVNEKATAGCLLIALGFKVKTDHIEPRKRKGPKIKFK